MSNFTKEIQINTLETPKTPHGVLTDSVDTLLTF